MAATLGAVGYLQARPKVISDTKFAALPQRERNLAIYDAFRTQLEKLYFDSKLLESPEWVARFDEWREKAAVAPDGAHLYTDVFYPLVQLFPSSHVGVLPPPAAEQPATPAAAGSSTAATRSPAQRSERLGALMRSCPAFELVQILRGGNANNVVGDVIAGSPADKTGIEPGWVVRSFSTVYAGETETMRFKGEFIRLPPENSEAFERDLQINLPDVKSAEEAQVALAAGTIKIEYDCEVLRLTEPFDERTLVGGVTYLRFDSFMDAALIDRAVAVIDSAGPKGLIVDLRRNFGGSSIEMFRVLERLLGNDAYIGTVRAGRRIQNMRTKKDGPHYSGPLVVLIGPATASAAEIVAAAVLDNKRGTLIGRMTNGSVLSSNYFPLGGGWRVVIPTHDYVRGGDRRIESVGVEPDIRVVPTLADVRAGRDPVIERAVAQLKSL